MIKNSSLPTYPRGNVGTSSVTDDVGPRGQLHDERDKVQERRDAGVKQFLKDMETKRQKKPLKSGKPASATTEMS